MIRKTLEFFLLATYVVIYTEDWQMQKIVNILGDPVGLKKKRETTAFRQESLEGFFPRTFFQSPAKSRTETKARPTRGA
jgi:hypothetical protein